jgi:predicted GIY-YIG superfamily endonuclease
MNEQYVYLLHFAKPIAPGRHTCQHYLGSAIDVDARLHEHLTGKGARLCQVAIERGIDFEVVRVWQTEPGAARQMERRLKNQKMGNRLCPICRNARKQAKRQLPMPWARPEYEALQFTLADVPEMRF